MPDPDGLREGRGKVLKVLMVPILSLILWRLEAGSRAQIALEDALSFWLEEQERELLMPREYGHSLFFSSSFSLFPHPAAPGRPTVQWWPSVME